MWPFDNNNQQVYQQYSQAYDSGNYNGFDPFQALGHITQFMQGAPIDTQHNLYRQHFEQMPYEQRAALVQQMPPEYQADPNDTNSLAHNFLRLGQERPNLLQTIFSHPLLLGASVGLAGLIAKHMLSRHQQHQQQNEYGNQQFGGGYNQGFQGEYQQNQYQQQNQYLQQEVDQLRREEQELRRELREEEQQQPQHHHHQHHHNQGY
ncbi:hypothetical protein KSF_053980 [Reticulibacter mediterranei]|uniref:Uncharacterized protein n=1 Tax=Reticulibacter mediterranei TaxID=2778369 RepID=A0A8J3N4H7_9CHLR|nr:hypothetical protein [Reticulibacter mediterranei]GHO95350.1 hypothetical protein KSF_053980 [Reticulibacter mediterranei]